MSHITKAKHTKTFNFDSFAVYQILNIYRLTFDSFSINKYIYKYDLIIPKFKRDIYLTHFVSPTECMREEYR